MAVSEVLQVRDPEVSVLNTDVYDGHKGRSRNGSRIKPSAVRTFKYGQ